MGLRGGKLEPVFVRGNAVSCLVVTRPVTSSHRDNCAQPPPGLFLAQSAQSLLTVLPLLLTGDRHLGRWPTLDTAADVQTRTRQ